ncbi:MAG: hypothetical protein KA792_01915 [Bacteroidales bacterium]|nr:hypothetical protein [Bacteroidales bacterium]
MQKAADVDASGVINPLDALQINRFYLGTLKSFKAGIWLFEDMDIIIKNNDVIFDIRGVCVGDANGSYKF